MGLRLQIAQAVASPHSSQCSTCPCNSFPSLWLLWRHDINYDYSLNWTGEVLCLGIVRCLQLTLCRAHTHYKKNDRFLQHLYNNPCLLWFILSILPRPVQVALLDGCQLYKTLTIFAAWPWLIGLHTIFFLRPNLCDIMWILGLEDVVNQTMFIHAPSWGLC